MANIITSGVFNLGALGGDGAASGGDSNWDDVVLLLDGSSTSDVTGLSTVTPSASGYSTNQTAGADGPKFIQYIDFQNIPAGYFNVAFPSALGVSNEPFTVETWAYFDAISNDGVFQLYPSSFSLGGSTVTHTASIAVAVSSSAWLFYDYGASTSGLGTASTGNWYHVAVVYDGTDLVLYVDGVALRTIARSMPAGGWTSIGIGGYYTTAYVMDGRIEGFRVTKGVARYTAAFNTDPVITSPAAWPTSAPPTKPTRRWGGITGRSLVESAVGYAIDHSLQLDASADYLWRTPTSAGDQLKWTLSFWVKKATQDARVYVWGAGTTSTELSYIQLGKNSDANRLSLVWRDGDVNTTYNVSPTAAFPTGVWTHVVMAFDAANNTVDDRIKLYIDGSLVTSFSNDDRSNLSGSSSPPMNAAVRHAIGVFALDLSKPSPSSSVQIADMHFIDGQALAETDFGEFVGGTWYPKAYTGTYGNNGWHLDFDNNTALGTDTSGNSNNWTAVSLTTGSQLTDVPSNAPTTDTLPTTGVLSLAEHYQTKL